MTIKDPNAEEEKLPDDNVANEPIAEVPTHDTGSMWFTVGGFFLPIIGLIGWKIFKKIKYMKNYKACKKGSIIGFIARAAVLLIFLLGLLISIL